jgi:hypothetical protein
MLSSKYNDQKFIANTNDMPEKKVGLCYSAFRVTKVGSKQHNNVAANMKTRNLKKYERSKNSLNLTSPQD